MLNRRAECSRQRRGRDCSGDLGRFPGAPAVSDTAFGSRSGGAIVPTVCPGAGADGRDTVKKLLAELRPQLAEDVASLVTLGDGPGPPPGVARRDLDDGAIAGDIQYHVYLGRVCLALQAQHPEHDVDVLCVSAGVDAETGPAAIGGIVDVGCEEGEKPSRKMAGVTCSRDTSAAAVVEREPKNARPKCGDEHERREPAERKFELLMPCQCGGQTRRWAPP